MYVLYNYICVIWLKSASVHLQSFFPQVTSYVWWWDHYTYTYVLYCVEYMYKKKFEIKKKKKKKKEGLLNFFNTQPTSTSFLYD